MKNCSEIRESISRYIDGELDANGRREFEEHIASCAACKSEMDDIIQIVGLCRDGKEEELPENFRTELHSKLLLVKEQDENKNKVIKLRTRYVKIVSSIAAGFLLIFLVKGFYDFGAFTNAKTQSSPESLSMKAEAPASADSAQANAAAAAAVNNDAVTGFGQDVQDSAASSDQTAKSEAGRSGTKENREASPKLASAFQAETASSTAISVTITVDDPGKQVDDIKALVTVNGGKEVKEDKQADSMLRASNQAVEVNAYFMIPKDQYDSFAGLLSSTYGSSNVETGAITTEDLTAKLDGLIAQSNDLDNSIRKLEDKNDTSNKDEIDELKSEKQATDNEIENIRLGTDFTNVAVTLRKK